MKLWLSVLIVCLLLSCVQSPDPSLSPDSFDTHHGTTTGVDEVNSLEWNDLNIRWKSNQGISLERDSLFPRYIYHNDGYTKGRLHFRPIALGEPPKPNKIANEELDMTKNEFLEINVQQIKKSYWNQASVVNWELQGSNKESTQRSYCGFVVTLNKNYMVYQAETNSSQSIGSHCETTLENLTPIRPIKSVFIKQKTAFSENTISFTDVGLRVNNLPPMWTQKFATNDYIIQPKIHLSNIDSSADFILLSHSLKEVNSRDVFKVYLQSVGIDPLSHNLVVNGKNLEYNANQTVAKGTFYSKKGLHYLALVRSDSSKWNELSQELNQSLQSISHLSIKHKEPTLNAEVLNQIGMNKLAQNQGLVALGYFEKANLLDTLTPIYLINCGFIFQSKHMYLPGTKYFESQLKLVMQHGKLLSILGEMHERLYNYSKALKYYELALDFSPYDEELVINQSDALWGIGYKNESFDVIRTLYQKRPSERLAIYMAKTYMGLDRYAEAIDLLYQRKKENGLSVEIGKPLVQALLFQERYEEALSINASILPQENQNAILWLNQGKSQYYLKQFKNALLSFKKAKKLNKQNDEVASFLSATQAFLGMGENKSIRQKVLPVTALSSLQKHLNLELYEKGVDTETPAVIHLQKESVWFKNKHPWRITEEWIVQISNKSGLALFDEFSQPFIPGYDRLYVNALKIYTKDLKLKNTGRQSDYYVTSELKESLSAETQLVHIPLKKIALGDIIHLQFSRQSLAKSSYFPFIHHKASGSLPIGLDIFQVNANIQNLQFEEYGNIEKVPTKKGLRWIEKNPVRIHKENFMPHYRDVGSGVLIGHKRSWSSVGEEYEKLIKHQFKNPISVREKTFELIGNKIDPEDKIDTLINWVRQNIRYQEAGFGGHSLIPQLSNTTLMQRNGDCKDQSLLLYELLNTINIPSKLTLINLQHPVSSALPSIQQFNHMILFIPKGIGYEERYVDLTEDVGTDRVIPFNLEGRNALIIDAQHSKLTTTPIIETTKEHKVELHHTIGLSNFEYTDFKDSLVLDGKFSAGLRDQLLNLSPQAQQEVFTKWFSYEDPSVELSLLEIENLNEFKKPLILKIIYRSKQIFENRDAITRGQVPGFFEKAFMRLPKMSQRHHPIRLNDENHFLTSINILYPKEWSTKIIEPSLKSSNYTSADITQESNPGKWSRNIKWSTFALYADPNEYSAIHQEWLDIIKATTPVLLWNK